MSSIIFQRVSFPYPSGEILRNVSFTCGSGERLCLIGPNGAGKTTILCLARGELTPTEGQVDANVPPPRDTASDEATLSIADYLEFRLAHLHRIRERFHACTHLLAGGVGDVEESTQEGRGADYAREYDNLLQQMTLRDLWNLDGKVAEIRAGLGVDYEDDSRPYLSLSPGQRRRLELALTLIEQPECLILDEPTNYLDIDAIDALEDALESWEGNSGDCHPR